VTEQQLYETVVVDTRPVVELGGQVHETIPELMVSLDICEQEGGLSQLELILDNTSDYEGSGLDFAFEHAESNLFSLGESVRILSGDAANPQEMFLGRISSVSLEIADGGQPRLCVLAEDGLMSWRMVRRNRSFPACPLRHLLERLTLDTSLTPVVTGLDVEVDAQQQANETDLAFLRRLLTRYDADAQVLGNELYIAPRTMIDRGSVTLEYGNQLRDIRVCADLAHQRSATHISGFDVAAGSVTSISSAADQLGPGAGVTGSETVEQVFPDASDRLTQVAIQHEREGKIIAASAQRRRARQFVTAEGCATGNTGIRVGARLRLEGLGPRFTNEFYTVSARHRFNRTEGFLTDFTAECAYLGSI